MAPETSIAASDTDHARDEGIPRDHEGDARRDRRDTCSHEHLALEGDVQHAAPLRQDAGQSAQRDRDGELEAAADHPRQVRGLAVQYGGEDRGDPWPDQQQKPRAPPEARSAQQLEDGDEDRHDAGDDPQHAHRGHDLGTLTALLDDPEREGGIRVERLRPEPEGQDPDGEEQQTPDPGVPRGALGRKALALVRRGGRRGAHTGAVGWWGATASAAGSLILIRQIDRIRFGAATNMMTRAMMKTRRSKGIPDWIPMSLPPDVSAPNSKAATTTPLGRRPAKQGEGDRREPDPAGQVEGQLADRPDDHE